MTDEARDRLCAGLAVWAVTPAHVAALAAVGPWLEACAAELPTLPPAGFIADLGHLATGAALPSERERGGDVQAPELTAALAAYDEHFIGRLAADPRWREVTDLVAAHGAGRWPGAVALITCLTLERLAVDPLALTRRSPSAQALRRHLRQPGGELVGRGVAVLATRPKLATELAAAYAQIARAARRRGRLVGDGLLHALANLDALAGLAQRHALAAVAEAAEALERFVPREARRGRAAAGPMASAVTDESTYPVGGYAALATVGPIENIVSSELVYLDRAHKPDLFEVRWASGELLRYTRDEAVFHRRRRTFVIVLHPELAGERLKDPGVRWQRIVLVLALLLVTVRRLSEWLTDESLRFVVQVIAGADGGQPLADETRLLPLVLRRFYEGGSLMISEAQSTEDVVATAAAEARSAETALVHLGAPAVDHAELSAVTQVALTLAGVTPVVTPVPTARPAIGDETLASWGRAGRDLLASLM